VDRLSMRALFPRLVDAEREHGSLLRAFRAQRSAPAAETHGAFRSLPGGLSELTRALVAQLPADAGADRPAGTSWNRPAGRSKPDRLSPRRRPT
jgi:protoporphyrinogen oxidase